MKKSIYLLLILVFFSCKNSNEFTTISGKITNTEDRKISINGESFEKEIKLKADGSFSENLPVEYEGIYVLVTSKNWIPIYFSKDSNISLTADDLNFNKTIKYSGQGSIENEYLAKKTFITSQFSDKDLYKLNEVDFLNKVNEIKVSISDLYDKTNFSNSYFKEKEALNFHFLEQKYFLFYRGIHGYFAQIKDFKVSDKFPKFDKKIDLDNDANFLFSTDYEDIVMTKFFENIKGDVASSYITAKDAIPEIKALKSQSIKNRLITNGISDINTGNLNYEQLYKEYVSITNDPKLIENLTISLNNAKALEIGNPSPKFDYENQKGGKTSLASLKGKYVYIDVWATWCGPCLQEIPSLQKVEEQYQDKNIEFVSISINKIKDREKWSNLVNNKQLGGIQLLADKDWDSKFITAYNIRGIPRFILIDPSGNIVNSDAPRPSEAKLIDLFNDLKI
jgi:thiol-disulfide isomerase/thioredoxin